MVTTLDQVFRAEWGRVLATLIGFLGDFDSRVTPTGGPGNSPTTAPNGASSNAA